MCHDCLTPYIISMSKKLTIDVQDNNKSDAIVEDSKAIIGDKKNKSKADKQRMTMRKNRAIELLDSNLSVAEVSRAAQIDIRTIAKELKTRYNLDIEDLREYQENQNEILEAGELLLIRAALDATKLQQLPTDKAINSLDKLVKLRRLTNNQSTQNVHVLANFLGKDK